MDDDGLAALIAAEPDLFPKLLDGDSRKWFVKKLLAHLETVQPAPTATTVEGILKRTREFALPAPEVTADDDPDKALLHKTQRILIVYGLVGVHPTVFIDVPLATVKNPKLLIFVAARRFAAVKTITEDFKNINFSAMRYSKPSAAATDYWLPQPPTDFPHTLKPLGAAQPVNAVSKLFEPAQGAARSAADCAVGAMLVHMRSLLVADNAETFMETLTSPDTYLVIDHPIGPVRIISDDDMRGGIAGQLVEEAPAGNNVRVKAAFAGIVSPDSRIVDADGPQDVEATFERDGQGKPTGHLVFEHLSRKFAYGSRVIPRDVPDFHLTSDQRLDRALFEQTIISLDDLQLGDHVYFANHYILSTWVPTQAWIGEHAFKVEGPLGRAGGFIGHGLHHTYTRLELSEYLLELTNNLLEYARAVLVQLADGIALGQGPNTTAQPPTPEMQAKFNKLHVVFQGTYDQFNLVDFDYSPWPGRESLVPQGLAKAFAFKGSVNGATAAPFQFIGIPMGGTLQTMVVVQTLPQPSLPGAKAYGLWFIDMLRGQDGVFPLFHQTGPRAGLPNIVTFDDMERPIAGLTREFVFVIRPRVSVYGPFLQHLTDSGAFPP